MKRRGLLAAAGGAARFAAAGGAVLLAGCSMLDGPRTITLSQAELQRLAERAFPIERRLLDVVDVSAASPQLVVLAERNRIGAELALAARERLFGGRWSGRLAFDAALRWDAADQTLRLADVRVERFTFDGSAGGRAQAERVAALLAEQALENLVVYRLTPERAARLEQAGVMPGTVAVKRSGIEVTLQAVPPRAGGGARP